MCNRRQKAAVATAMDSRVAADLFVNAASRGPRAPASAQRRARLHQRIRRSKTAYLSAPITIVDPQPVGRCGGSGRAVRLSLFPRRRKVEKVQPTQNARRPHRADGAVRDSGVPGRDRLVAALRPRAIDHAPGAGGHCLARAVMTVGKPPALRRADRDPRRGRRPGAPASLHLLCRRRSWRGT